jgi:hypothetical protein
MDFIVAIPSYDRSKQITKKSLVMLSQGNVDSNKIYVFVANEEEEEIYQNELDPKSYHKIVVGKKGLVNQRIFISQYFPEGQMIVSVDDDIEHLLIRPHSPKNSNVKLTKLIDVNQFLTDAFIDLQDRNLYLWGVYPTKNPYWMMNDKTTDLRFIIGCIHGYINRHDSDLYPDNRSLSKEDIEQSVLFFMKDKGVLRYNNVSFKTKWNDIGGLGTDRFQMNKDAQEYLCEKYPQYLKPTFRKSGSPEVRFSFQK